MASEVYKKKELASLIKLPGNSKCADCPAPNPQWASLGFGSFVCLECSGAHRGLGVHITFVRSVTMDKWSDEQLKKMKLGGNTALNDFLISYGPEGGYSPNMDIKEKYNSWAAAQYKEKLAAECSDPPAPWTPSAAPPASLAPPATASSNNTRPTSAQGVRGSRGTYTGSGVSSSDYPSGPSSLSGYNDGGGGYSDEPQDERFAQKAANESFFASMGNKNASRREDLPPSQGGKYAGFGSTPDPLPQSNHPSFALSSHNAPSLDEIRNDPMKAASKGWGLFSAAVSAASRTVQSTIVEPAIQQLSDPNLHQNVRSGLSTAATQASRWGTDANGFVRDRAGVDLVSKLGELGIGASSGSGGRGGYTAGQNGGFGGPSAGYDAYKDEYEDDYSQFHSSPAESQPARAPAANAPAKKATQAAKKKTDDWDDFEDF